MAKGSVELIKTISTPFVTLVVADLLGVPAEDRQHFMNLIESAPPPGSLDSSENDYSGENHPMVAMAGFFARYIMERKQNPRGDILSEFAHAEYSDGTRPRIEDLVALSTFIFGAGQDTSAKLLGNSMRYLVDEPGLQKKLRQDPSLIPAMLEEVLRLEGSTKQTARLARRDTQIGDLRVPAGTKVLVALSAANRDRAAGQILRHSCSIDRQSRNIWDSAAVSTSARVHLWHALRCESSSSSSLNILQTSNSTRTSTGACGDRELDFEPSFIIRGTG